jgi:hypothetical protein
MRNLLEAAIADDDGDRAATTIREALGINSDEVVNFAFPKHWPADRGQRARIVGEWLRAKPDSWSIPTPNNAAVEEKARALKAYAVGSHPDTVKGSYARDRPRRKQGRSVEARHVGLPDQAA